MKTWNILIFIIVGIILIGGIFLLFNNSDKVDDVNTGSLNQEGIGEEAEKSAQESSPQAKTLGKYEIYSPQKVASAEGNIVLFFHASWCPSCRALNKDIEESLNDIPSDLTILKVDYDEETELKQKYEVTTQHTLVQVDKEGNLIKKWSGGSSLELLLSQIK